MVRDYETYVWSSRAVKQIRRVRLDRFLVVNSISDDLLPPNFAHPYFPGVPAMIDPMSRRTFVKALAVTTAVSSASKAGLSEERVATTGMATEWSYVSGKQYSDPFNQVDVDAIVTTPSGREERIPAFWAGDSIWRVRYQPQEPGLYKIRSVCSDSANRDLHGQSLVLNVQRYAGANPHYKHGVLQVAADKRYFQYADGTPFFWLGDTWWMGFCKRLNWPDGFQTLAADRIHKGFTMV